MTKTASTAQNRSKRSRPSKAARERTGTPVSLPAAAGFSRRSALLIALLLLIGITYLPFVRVLANQRSELNDLRQKHKEHEAAIADLDKQLAQWDDPAFVRAQARERLRFVMPGEVAYAVLSENGEPATTAGAPSSNVVSVGQSARRTSWSGSMWSSIMTTGLMNGQVTKEMTDVGTNGPQPAPVGDGETSPVPTP